MRTRLRVASGGGFVTHYTLVFAANAEEAEKQVEFDAADASTALILAHQEALNRPAALWLGTRKLCTIRRTKAGDGDIWQIGAA